MSSHIKLNVKNPERKSATNMLTKILSNTLASEINCDGGHGKIAFKSLKLYDLFQGNYLLIRRIFYYFYAKRCKMFDIYICIHVSCSRNSSNSFSE